MIRSVLARALAATAAIVGVGFAVVTPAANAAETRTISGVVTMPGATDPLALDAVTLYVTPEGSGSGTSINVTSTGAFSATGLAPGRYTVCANPAAYTNASGEYGRPYNVLSACIDTTDPWGTRGTVDVTGGDVSGLTLALPSGQTIKGTVTLPAGADPEWLRGVYVQSQMLVPGGFVVSESKVDLDTGAYELHSLFPGSHSVLVRVRSYVDPGTGATITPPLIQGGLPAKVDVTGGSVTGANVTMPPLEAPSVFVVTPKPVLTGAPVVGGTLVVDPGAWSPAADSFEYVWVRNGTAVPGATGSSYLITAEDLNKQLFVTVIGKKAGLSAAQIDSERTTIRSTFTTVGTPTIAGTAQVGSPLTCAPGTWVPTPSAIAYKWTRAGSAISGATASTYVVQAADAGAQLRCVVTASPYPEVTRSSAAVVPLKAFASAGNAVIAGEANLGNPLTASVAGVSPAPSTVEYRWYRNGIAIPSATSATYTVTAADSLAVLSVSARVNRSGYASLDAAAAQVAVPKLFTSAPAPSITGRVDLGQTLSATVPAWSPAATISYQWLRNGTAIPSASGSTYTLTAADQSSTIEVRVVGTAATLAPVTRSASVTSQKFFTANPVPTITRTGNTLHFDVEQVQEPYFYSINYEWRRDGVVIGANSPFFALSEADFGHTFTAKATAWRPDYNDRVLVAAAFGVPLATFTRTPDSSSPTIDGTVAVGVEASAAPASLSPTPEALTYQWLSNGSVIPGATASTYVPTAAQVGGALSVAVTATRTGHVPLTLASAPVTIAPGSFGIAPAPTISGTVRAGSTVKAIPGTWSPAATSYSYRWYRSGTAISGATSSSYKITASDRGKKLTVRVTAKRAGYTSASATSAARTVPYDFTKTVTPTITGTAKAGSTLTAVRGTWKPTPTYSYQWYRNGVKISGATAKTYKVKSIDKGKKITVKVTGKRSGYYTVTKTSASRTIAR